MFITDVAAAAAEGPAVTAAAAAVPVYSTATAAAENGCFIRRDNSSHNAAANIVFLAGVCSRRTAATTASPYFISRK
jgi:hypothetical protein